MLAHSILGSTNRAMGHAPMIEPTEIRILSLTPKAYATSSRIRSGEDGSSEVERESVVRMQTIVGELLAAIRGLLQGDREAAEVSVDRVAEMVNRGGGTRTMTRLVGCIPSEPPALKIRGGLAPWQLRRVIAHIESHLDGAITTQDLATIAKVSTCHFTQAFRESVSETPHGYVMRRRIERAQGLMLTTGIALGRIAIDCGFADQAHFNKLFRRLVGESPGVWRRARLNPPLVAGSDASPMK